jgi:hypothetical protein
LGFTHVYGDHTARFDLLKRPAGEHGAANTHANSGDDQPVLELAERTAVG